MKRTVLAILACLVFFASTACTAFAQSQPSPWRQFGPGGGSISSVAVDPRDPSVLYAATGFPYNVIGLVYKSTNGGRTWQSLLEEGFEVVAVDPDHPDTVLAGGFEMRRSTDGGRTWQPDLLQGPDRSVRVLTMAPGGLAFAGTYERLLRSVDSGASWSEVLEGLVDVRSIEVDPDDPSRAYAVTREALYVSTDAGAHWTRGARPGTEEITRLALAPSSPATLFALIGERQIFRSDDHAATWRLLGELPKGREADVLLVAPRSSSTVYAAGDGVFTSLDGGKTWVDSNLGLPRPGHAPMRILSLAVAPSQPETLFAGTLGWGVARRRGAGDSWRIGYEPGLTAAWISMLDFHPRKPGTVYLALGGQGSDGARSFRSTDNGRTWRPFARGMTQDGLRDLAFDPTDPNLVYAATPVATWRSTDAGETWEKVSNEGGRHMAFTGRGALLSSGCGMKRSTDGGATWREVIACTDEDGKSPRWPLSLLVDSKDLNTVYVRFYVSDGAGHQSIEIFKSQNGGRTWKPLQVPGAPSLFAMAPSDSRILYVVSMRQEESLLRSVDGGETWTAVNQHFSQVHSLSGEMEVDGADPDKLYLPASNGILVSRDGGRSFELFDEPLEEEKRDTSELWTDRTQPGLVFASPRTGGLFVRRFE